jgi:hypothetical protein
MEDIDRRIIICVAKMPNSSAVTIVAKAVFMVVDNNLRSAAKAKRA